MEESRARIEQAFLFDIEHNSYWFQGWGPRPDSLQDATHIALSHIRAAPALVPIYAHRCITTLPAGWGNPVLSVWQAIDTVYIGNDLADYLYREFRVPRPYWAADETPVVPVWGDLFDLFNRLGNRVAPPQK
jgi:hypothetical protein